MSNSLETATLLLNETLAIQKESIETAADLLKETTKIRKECEKRYKETGETYNIFKSAGISKREVYMCNVLFDLLNLEGSHYRKDMYLKLFMDMVVKPLPQLEKAGKLVISKKTRVIREHPTDKDQRIDIVIKEEGKVFIPIEAKIGTCDSKGQLKAYAEESKRLNPAGHFIPVLYLTPSGDDAQYAKKEEVYVPISFKEHIVPWLQACLEFEKTKKAPPVEDTKNILNIREINLTQYIKAIKSICGIMEDEAMKEKIIGRILTSEDNYEAALNIRDAVNALTEGKLDKELGKFFKNQILDLVKKEFPQAEPYSDEWLEMNLKNGLQLSVTSDVKKFVVQKLKPNLEVDGKKKKEINEKMSGMLHDELNEEENKNHKGIWAGINARHPDIDEEDDDMYKYKLYQTYKNKPQSVANWIMSIAKELENIKMAAKPDDHT